MQVKCDFCGSMVDESNETCTKCGAPLSGAHRTAKEQPKTIEELRAWYIAHHLPPEEITRFFIGKNITEPKAFGIYRDSYGDFVVYKNKSTGERAVRYKGADEKYAVNELYQRLIRDGCQPVWPLKRLMLQATEKDPKQGGPLCP